MPRVRVDLFALAVAVPLVLVGCGSPASPRPDSTDVSTTPTAALSEPAFSSAPPTSRFDIDCDDLRAAFAPALPGAVVQDPRGESSARLTLITADAVLNASGAACLVSNGVSQFALDTDAAFVGIELYVVPDAAAAFATVSGTWDLSDLGQTPVENYVVCPVHRLFGETYVSARLRTHDASSDRYAVCRALRDYVDGLAGLSAAPAEPRDGDVSPITDCSALLTADDIVAVSGAALVADSWFDYSWNDASGDAAQLVSGLPNCNWDDGTSTNGINIKPLLGGAWLGPLWAERTNRQPLPIEPARPGDAAWVDYDPAYPDNALLFVVSGGSGFEMQTWIPGDQVANALRVAQTLVDRLAA